MESYRGFRNARLADGMGYYHPLRRTRTSVNPTIARNKMTAMTAGASAFRALPLTGSSAKSRLCILLFRNPNDFLVFIFFSFPIRTGPAPEFAYSLTQAEWHVLTFVSRQWAGCLLKRRLKMMSFPRKRSMNLIAALEHISKPAILCAVFSLDTGNLWIAGLCKRGFDRQVIRF